MLGGMALPIVSVAQPAPATADGRTIQSCLDRSDVSLGQACIGVVANPCMAAADGDDAKVKSCIRRELAIWEAQLEAALRRVKRGGFRELTDAVSRSQEAWQASRGALCPVFDKIDPGMLPGGASHCAMHETASRALVLRRLAEAVGEH
jgi:uncharacterized protein YecT (DUF1311 family)